MCWLELKCVAGARIALLREWGGRGVWYGVLSLLWQKTTSNLSWTPKNRTIFGKEMSCVCVCMCWCGSRLYVLLLLVCCCVVDCRRCVVGCVNVVVDAFSVELWKKRHFTSVTGSKTIPVIVHKLPRKRFISITLLINAKPGCVKKKHRHMVADLINLKNASAQRVICIYFRASGLA